MSCRAARPLHSSVLAPLRRQHPVHAARRPLLAPSRLVVRSGGAEADQLQQTARDGHLNNSGRPKPQRVGPCSNPNCGSPTTSGQWYLAPEGSGVAGAVCFRCYQYNRLKGVLPILAPAAILREVPQKRLVSGMQLQRAAVSLARCATGATITTAGMVYCQSPKGSGVAGVVCARCYSYNRRNGVLPVSPKRPKLHGPCCNPACGATETTKSWHSAPEGSGVAGAVCARCYKYNRLKGLLPLSPVQPKLHGPCSNPACGATETTGNWNSAPEGSGVAGAVCDRCYKYNRRKGALPVWRILPKLHGPCSNPACGATESTKSWHSAPEGSGVAGAVCSRCYHYNRLKGVLPVSPKRAKLHGPCCNPACGAPETSVRWYSAPKGSGVAGAVCSRCYQYNRLKGVLPMFPPLVYWTKLHDS
ncbi:hypothetical protein D9Q98_007557 [Chlorella vulgaris]|uniref:Uncharacterized protein n=1 Tax=Chlorella vulgaris TaxID=3077 RepID=A0A9D4TLM5_CHLVU|nr:hypothetical protein D9Q98_007557 [Chlorella vulgaris]